MFAFKNLIFFTVQPLNAVESKYKLLHTKYTSDATALCTMKILLAFGNRDNCIVHVMTECI